MAQAPLTLDQMREAIDLVAQHGNVNGAANASGIAESTLRRRYHQGLRAAERGEFGTDAVIPSFRISQVTTGADGKPIAIQQKPGRGEVFEIPKGHVLKGVSAYVDQDGRVSAQWVKTRAGEIDPDQLIEILKGAFGDMDARAPTVGKPLVADNMLLTVYPLVDWHVGLMSWALETGENYDLKIARETIMPAMRNLIAATPPAEEAVILGIGDLLHWDGFVQETPASKHPLDGDGRYPKVLETAADMVEETVELALAHHRRVTVRILRGNHDPVSSVAVSMALKRVFRANKRVTIDADQGYHFWLRRGKVFIGASHGDKAKMRDLPMVMAHDRPTDWAASTYRRIYTGHFHSERRLEEGGVIVTCMRSPVAKDAYHSFNKWRSGRSVYSETFHLDGSEAATLTFNL